MISPCRSRNSITRCTCRRVWLTEEAQVGQISHTDRLQKIQSQLVGDRLKLATIPQQGGICGTRRILRPWPVLAWA